MQFCYLRIGHLSSQYSVFLPLPSFSCFMQLSLLPLSPTFGRCKGEDFMNALVPAVGMVVGVILIFAGLEVSDPVVVGLGFIGMIAGGIATIGFLIAERS